MTRIEKFKGKGAEILQADSGPGTMSEFLDLPEKEKARGCENANTATPLHKSADTQNHTAVFPETVPAESETETTRLHVHIRKDLADALYDEVLRRKKDRSVPNKEATQRIIIEQALEAFFNRA